MAVAFIFTRDLRLIDNRGLTAAAAEATQRHVPLFTYFVCERQQLSGRDFPKSQHAIAFMFGALADLPCTFIESLDQIDRSIASVYIGDDCSPFAKERIARYDRILLHRGASLQIVPDMMTVTKSDGSPYVVFGAYWKAAQGSIGAPDMRTISHRITWHDNPLRRRMVAGITVRSRRDLADVLEGAPYDPDEGFGISAYLRFGVVSLREVHAKCHSPALRRQLGWRGFFLTIMDLAPQLLMPGHYAPLTAEQQGRLHRWTHGRTGCEIVDLAMQDLLRTGRMPNRLRMIVAYYLTAREYLHVHWWWGAKVFAQFLQDYDWAINTGNWMWIADPHKPWARPPYEKFVMERQAKHPAVMKWLESRKHI